MLGSLQPHSRKRQQSHVEPAYEEYPSMSDVLEEEDFDENGVPYSPAPASDHVYTRDSPQYQPISAHDLVNDASDHPYKHSYTEREAILMFNRTWHMSKEQRLAPSLPLFQRNRELTLGMRCRLINWLMEVCIHFRLHRETFYLAVYFVDRYLSLRTGVSKLSLQLLGVSALFIAAKLEEIYPPNIREFADVCDGSCPEALIHETEINILMTLRWHLNAATPVYWIGLYTSLLSPYLAMCEHVLLPAALEVLDLALHTPKPLLFPYSVLAASALALFLLEDDAMDMIEWATGHAYRQLQPCMSELRQMLSLCASTRMSFPKPQARIKNEDFDRIIRHNSTAMKLLLTSFS